VLHRLDPSPSLAVELPVLIAASAAATVTRYVALRAWVFARGPRVDPHCPERPALDGAGR
jgi:hypothetical protein